MRNATKAPPKTVTRDQLSLFKMTTGGEKKYPIVVLGDRVKEWVGFGWIDIGEADAADRERFPLVVDA